MRNVSRAAIPLFALGVIVAGCAQKRATPAARSAPTPPPAVPASNAAAQAEARSATEAAPQEKKPKHGEVSVFVDGKEVGVLRPLELPAGIKTRTVDLGSGYTATRWAFTDYAAALGIPAKKIKALHLYGGSRIVVVDAKELAREGDGLRFGFLQGDRGKPRVVFPPMKLGVKTTIDLLSRVAFYVDKEPPHLDEHGDLVMPDGKPAGERGPYVETDSGKGTRVYVDGKLVGAVKRKKLSNDLVVSKQDEKVTRFSLAGYEGTLGVDASKAKAVDLLAGDDVVARMAPAEAKSATFSVPRHNQGKILVDVGGSPAKLSAVQIYVKTAPPSREITKLEDAVEASPSQSSHASSGSAGGSDDDEM
jgi:hypothetical protein